MNSQQLKDLHRGYHNVQEQVPQLAQEKALLEAIVHSIQEGLCVSNASGQAVMVNPACVEMYGLDPDTCLQLEVNGSALSSCNPFESLQVCHPDGSRPLATELPSYRASQGEAFTDQELIVQLSNGDRKWMSVSGSAIRDETGQILLAVTTSRDITEHKQAEGESVQVAIAVEHEDEAIEVTDAEGKIEYVNSAFEKITGYSRSEVMGQFPASLLRSGQYDETFYQEIWETISSGRVWNGCYTGKRKNGSFYYQEVTVAPICDASGVITNYVAVKRDITKRKQAEEELRCAKEAAEAGNQAKSNFLAIMSHELRTPLNAILGLTGLLRQEVSGPLTDKQRDYINCVHNSGEHLLSLISDILDLSKIEAGKEDLVFTPVAVPELCEHCLMIVREQAHEQKLRLTSQIDPKVGTLIADERRLRQMLLNLLSNAIKFTPAGEVALTVTRHAQEVSFTVTDTGIGIASEHLPLLFEPFYQTDSQLTRRYEGTGLGLALTRHLARLHGGDVSVKSTSCRGSEFTIDLPDVPPYPEAYEMAARFEEVATVSARNKTAEVDPLRHQAIAASHSLIPVHPGLTTAKRIFLIEDDNNSAVLMQDYLESLGYEVEHLTTEASFLQRLTAFQPHIVLLSPQLSKSAVTLDLLNNLRKILDFQHLPVVVVIAAEGDREQFLAAGATACLIKPINISDLAEALLKHL